MSIGSVLNRLNGVSGSQGRFKALCPIEPAHHIRVIESHGGRVYMKCNHHKEHELVDAVNLPISAIFPNNYFFPEPKKQHPKEVYLQVFLDLIQEERKAGRPISEADKKKERDIFMMLRQAK